MSEQPPPDLDRIARQLAQHLDSYRLAGIEWVPNQTSPLPAPATAAPISPPVSAVPLPTVPVQPPASLFAPPSLATPVADSREQRQAALDELRQQVAGCLRCPELASQRTQTVFGTGPLDPDLCFIGEAPGFEEDRSGEPFVGPAGQLLTRMITACGMKREEVFICNILRCRPPNNRTPTPEEARLCSEWLDRTLDLVRPKFLCLLGNTPLQALLGMSGITRLHGRFFEYRGIPALCTFHPSYLLRSPEKKKEAWEDLQVLLQRMGRPIPGKS